MADEQELTADEVAALTGATVLEFGASWCGFCKAARPVIDRALADQPALRHIWVEDGKGKRLGRAFGVKLWPTVVVLRDGKELARFVRPGAAEELHAAVALAVGS